MDEITVVLQQEPGKVSWNYEEVKRFLAEEMKKFQGIVYTDDTIKSAKDDRAFLNKLSKQIDEKRKEAKERCLEPYQLIEEQAKELKALIGGPVKEIDDQVKAYEVRRQERVKEEIGQYFDEKYKAAQLPEAIRKKVVFKIWNPKWLNVSTSKKAWKDGVDSGIDQVKKDIEAIESFESEFEDDMKQTYGMNLMLQEAIRTMNDLNRQKERVLEMERRKQEVEQERIRRQQESAAEQARKENAQNTPENTQSEPENVQNEAESVQDLTGNAQQIENTEQLEKGQEEAPEVVGGKGTLMRVYGDDLQLRKILGYIKYVGAKVEIYHE